MDILDNPDLRWSHFEGNRHFDYPIDYWGAILDVRDDGRHLDMDYAIGVAIKANEMAVEYAQVRETFGATLSSRQSIQWMLVDNEMDIQQAR